MRTLVPALLLVCTACPAVNPDPKDGDSDPVVDTVVVIDSGWGTIDSEPADSEDTDPPDSEPDTEPLPVDTSLADCAIDELRDCDGACYPAYYLGDGTCDDGTVFASNFHCVLHAYDAGDCLDDGGGPIVSGTPCPWVVRINTRNDANEISWRITNLAGRVVYEAPYGLYTNVRTYNHTVALPSGVYEFVTLDGFADGWGGGGYQILGDDRETVLQGTMLGGAAREVVPLELDCDEHVNDGLDQCGAIIAEMSTRSWGGEVGWHIRARGTTAPLVSSPAYLSDESVNTGFVLPSGWYELVRDDAGGDGWNGATLTLRDNVSGVPLLSTSLLPGDPAAVEFPVDCSEAFDPFPPTSPVVTCEAFELTVQTVAFGADYGWFLTNAAGVAIASAPEGLYGNSSQYSSRLNLEPGDYTLNLTDAEGDGWDGGSVRLTDVESEILIFTGGLSFTDGFDFAIPFTITCPEPPVEPEPSDCPEGAQLDCTGTCWPSAYVGDGTCDDGVDFAPDFDCEAASFDGGDCGTVP
jgi:hypothetical protein